MPTKLRLLPLIAFTVLAILTLGACLSSSGTGDTIPEDFQVTLEKGACRGFCPVYSLTVSAGGAVTYEGMDFVEVTGQQTATLSESEVMEVFDAVQAADYFSLEDRYATEATDLPTTTTTVTMNGETKSVDHYGLGCDNEAENAPAELCELEALMEDIAISNGWVAPI